MYDISRANCLIYLLNNMYKLYVNLISLSMTLYSQVTTLTV